MEEAFMHLCMHFGFQMPPPPTPHCPPLEPKHTDIGDEAIMIVVDNMVVQTVRETPED